MSEPTASAPASAIDLSVELGPLRLDNPLMTASGTFGYGLEFAHLCDLASLGGIVTKGLSLEPRRGNPPPRICETRGGMLNSIGLQNIGIEKFLAEVLPGLGQFPARVVVNLFGTTVDEYVRLAARVDAAPGVAAVELNVSCPNVTKGGIEFGQDPEILEGLVRAVRAATGKPILVKLSPNVTRPVDLGHAARAGGADILSAINTVLGMAIDPVSRRPRLATVKGGLSGPAIKPIALRIVFDVARQVGLPVVGIGGIETADDVLEFLLAGASAVQVGTALFRDPATPQRILGELRQRLAAQGVEAPRRSHRRGASAGGLPMSLRVRPIERLAVALDTPDWPTFASWCDRFGPRVGFLKVGLEAYVRWGPPAVARAREAGARIFLDLKLHDIPNTVAGAVSSASDLGVELLTLHAGGGPAMMAAAATAAANAGTGLQLLAVTVLTHLDAGELAALGLPGTPTERAISWALMAREAGCAGVVCSPLEAAALRARLPRPFRIVTPGIRLPEGDVGDQRRVATPAAALAAGADLLVVGRPLTRAEDAGGGARRLRPRDRRPGGGSAEKPRARQSAGPFTHPFRVPDSDRVAAGRCRALPLRS